MKIEKTLQSKRHGVDFENLKFGERFSDHMASCEYRDDKWQTPEIIPFGNISVSPAMCCFHYGQMVFEGLKAFYAGDRIISSDRKNTMNDTTVHAKGFAFHIWTRSCF